MQIWQSEQKGDDKIIAFFNQSIYKANPKTDDIFNYVTQLKSNFIPKENALEIPLSYIKEITMEEGKEYIEVRFGSDSSEQFIVSDNSRRQEIFECLKKNLPVEEAIETSKIRAARKPLIAMAVVTGIFIWTLYIAINVENGIDYDVQGDRRSLAGIVLLLASLGVRNVILIFGSLVGIAIWAAIRKYKNSTPVHRLQVKR